MNTLANRFGPRTDYASFANRKFLHFQPKSLLVQAGNFQMKIIAVLLMLFGITSINAFAADQGFYANIDTGIYLFSNAPQGESHGIRISGGYNFNPYVGVETGYSIIEDATSDECVTYIVTFTTCPQETLSGSLSQVAIVGTIPLNDHQSLFGKLGWANTSLDYSYSYTPCFLAFCDPPITGSGSATKTNPMFGIGWQSNSFQNFYLRVQYENLGKIKLTSNYNNQPSKTYDIGIEVISVGLVYKF